MVRYKAMSWLRKMSTTGQLGKNFPTTKYLEPYLAIAVLGALLNGIFPVALLAQEPDDQKLFITIVDGDEAVNNIRRRTNREAIVQVEDHNHKPVAGAIVVFTLPNQGAGGTFAGNGSNILTATTDQAGRAVAVVKPNAVAGNYQMSVRATKGTLAGVAVVKGANVLGAAGGIAGLGVGLTVAIIAGVVAGGVIAGTQLTGGGSSRTRVSVGTPTLP